MTRAMQRTYGQWWDSTEQRVSLRVPDVEAVALAGLQAAGASAEDARFLMTINLDKALQGDHIRGIGYILKTIERARNGAADLRPEFRVVRQRGATALVDATPGAAGGLLWRYGMRLAIAKARAGGIGLVCTRGASGGFLTPIVKLAVAEGMVGMMMTQSSPTVAPLGGFKPLLGNAPVAVGIPAGDRDPVILDMSLTQSSHSGVMLAARQGQQVPAGVLLDERGNPTTDARDYPATDEGGTRSDALIPMLTRGSLAVLGDGHKGYALVFVVGLLSALLADASPPWDLDYQRETRGSYGTMHIAIDPSAFRAADGIGSFVDDFIDTVKSQPKKEGVADILYPGERSQQLQRSRRSDGFFEVPRSDAEALRRLAEELGVRPPRLGRQGETDVDRD